MGQRDLCVLLENISNKEGILKQLYQHVRMSSYNVLCEKKTIALYEYEKVRVAYSHSPSRSCGELGDPSGPQTRMDPTEGAFGPLSDFPIGLLGESYKVR